MTINTKAMSTQSSEELEPTSNVVFLQKKALSPPMPSCAEEVNVALYQIRSSFLSQTATDIAQEMALKFALAGFKINDPALKKDLVLMRETILAILFKIAGYKHPIHNVAEHIFETYNPDVPPPQTPNEIPNTVA